MATFGIAPPQFADELRKLLKARYNEALSEAKVRYRAFAAGAGPFNGVLTWVDQRFPLVGATVA